MVAGASVSDPGQDADLDNFDLDNLKSLNRKQLYKAGGRHIGSNLLPQTIRNHFGPSHSWLSYDTVLTPEEGIRRAGRLGIGAMGGLEQLRQQLAQLQQQREEVPLPSPKYQKDFAIREG